MEVKVYTNISKKYENIEICLNAPEINEEVKKIENDLRLSFNKTIKEVLGVQGNDIYIINIEDVIKFYSEDKNNFCKTKDGVYKLKEKMYFLEDALPKNSFIRISNSVIINVKHIKCFNTDIIGKIAVKFNDDTEEYVSKRKIPDVMKFLKDRRG